MRQLLCYAVSAAMVILACTAGAAQTTAPAKKKTTSTYKKKSAVMARKTAPLHKSTPSPAVRKTSPSTSNTIARRGTAKKGPVKKATTWRTRQMTPSADRYKEIQEALVAKGYLNAEEADGTWNQASIEGLKKFQAAQNLDSTGKINSLSLIALGLGPKHDATPVPAQ